MNWIKHSNQILYRRIIYILGALAIYTFIIIATLIYLQIYCGDTYRHHGVRNFTRYETITSPRGDILDITGRAIATNRPVINIYWHGTEKSHWDPYQQHVISHLEDICDRRLHDDPHLIQAERRGRTHLIARDVSFEALSAISERFPHTPNIHIDTQFQRYYPFQSQAAHIIGHINRSQHGKMGLEYLYNTQLCGHAGYVQKQITATGKTIDRTEIIPATSGAHIQTTLDMQMQECAENAFLQHEHNGVILCLNGNTGDITALVSRPSFDPNTFTGHVDPDTWKQWQETCALLNRACNALYPPASIFKLITTATALEEEHITPESTWYCSGYTRYGKRIYACNKRSGHQSITMTEAIAHSCNIPFYEIGKELSIDTIAEYAQRFGLNQPTGCILPENSGLVPTMEWKEANLGERWWQGETLAATIGQSYLLVTPLQIACMVNAICQGHLVRPRIVASEPIHITPLDISDMTREFLQEAIRTVVTTGRAKDVGKIEHEIDGLTLHAKTGTAQTSHRQRRQHGSQFLEHGWFVTHIQYRDHDPITLVVLLEHIGSSRIAGHTARNFIRSYCQLCDERDCSAST